MPSINRTSVRKIATASPALAPVATPLDGILLVLDVVPEVEDVDVATDVFVEVDRVVEVSEVVTFEIRPSMI